jgi:transcriptional regulator with PAS, ATPase and Fis domain
MSSSHAQILRSGATWRLEDSGSRNGTRVNGSQVAHAALRDGDLVEIGHAVLLFREALHGPPGTTLDLDTSSATMTARGLATLVPALASEVEALVRISTTAVPVLLRGETGTGKELVARAVHASSGRGGAFVPVNCGAIPPTLMESQLFGHAKGAFSGALRDEPGFVRAATGGTLFLDEIGDMPPASQAALLRVLQEGEVVPVGSSRAVPVDLRVVAATHQPLEALVARGTFRNDLLARLDGFTFVLPPLRERREDIGLIVADLLGSLSPAEPCRLDLSAHVGRALLTYPWPLNVRELRHCLARGLTLAQDGVFELGHLPKAVAGVASDAAGLGDLDQAQETAEEKQAARLREQLEALLTEHRGNVAEVARAMGKARMQVQRWMKRLAIDPGRYRR